MSFKRFDVAADAELQNLRDAPPKAPKVGDEISHFRWGDPAKLQKFLAIIPLIKKPKGRRPLLACVDKS